jgi:hypothetical protein
MSGGTMGTAPLGKLVAVCGLAPGAGSSTIARLIAGTARAASGEWPLLCELEEPPRGAPRSSALCLTQRDGERDDQALAEAIRAVRVRRAATIVDCGTVRTRGAALVLGAASHIVWVVEASSAAAGIVISTLLDGDPGVAPGGAAELVAVSVQDPAVATADLALRNAVAERCRRLVLVTDLKARSFSTTGSRSPGRRARTAIAPIAEFVGLRT